MNDRVDAVAVERLLEATAAHEGVNLHRLALDRAADRSIMQQRHPLPSPQPGECLFQFQYFLHGRLHDRFDGRLAPGLEGAAAETAEEALGPANADAADFDGVAV